MPRLGYEAVHLVTGFPSFYARKMIEHILAREPESFLYMTAEAAHVAEAQALLSAMMGEQRDRVGLLEGKPTAIDFGLSGAEFRQVTREVERIHHMVHTTDTKADRKAAEALNVGSAAEILEIARASSSLQCLVFHSTAAVSGERQGVVYEGELDEGQSFGTVIAETRMRAEMLIRRAMRDVPIAVVRPTTLVGGTLGTFMRAASGPVEAGAIGAPATAENEGSLSVQQSPAAASVIPDGAAEGASGGTVAVPLPAPIERLEGIYLLVLLLIATPADLALPLPGASGEVPLHIVPIDYVVRAAYEIGRHPTSPGRTFHLADPKPPSARRVIELVSRAGRPRAARGYVPSDLAKMLLRTPGIERFVRSPRAFLEQLLLPVRYDTRNTEGVLAGTGIECPPFESYVEQLVAIVQEYVRSRRERRVARMEAEVDDPLS